MPLVKTLSDRVQKFTAKTAPDRVGPRYEAAKPIALRRFIEGAGRITAVRELVRDVLERNGVPAALHGVYYAFAFKLTSKAMSHYGPELQAIAAGLKAEFVGKGADPAILDLIEHLIIG